MSSETVATALNEAGFDLLHRFDLADYNQFCKNHESLKPVPSFDQTHLLALLVGNTRTLWPTFLHEFRESAELQRSSDPFDLFVQRRVEGSLGSTRCIRRYAHQRGDELVSMLNVANLCGFAKLGPAHIAIHQTFGPWFALRAVLVFDEEPVNLDPPCAGSCEGCDAPCRVALDAALHSEEPSWYDWVKVRTSCPIGQSSRYSPIQEAYHYTKNLALLFRD